MSRTKDDQAVRTEAELQRILDGVGSVPKGSVLWSIRISEALDLIVPALREAWAARTDKLSEANKAPATSPCDEGKIREVPPPLHRLDTRCGSPDCDSTWRIAPEQARVGCLLTCFKCGSRTRVIDVTEYYIRTTWPA